MCLMRHKDHTYVVRLPDQPACYAGTDPDTAAEALLFAADEVGLCVSDGGTGLIAARDIATSAYCADEADWLEAHAAGVRKDREMDRMARAMPSKPAA